MLGPEVDMRIDRTHYRWIYLVMLLAFELILAPVSPGILLAADQESDVTDADTADQPAGTGGGSSTGVDVSGSGESTPSGKGVLAPPPRKEGPAAEKPQEKIPTAEKPPVESAQPKKTPKGIGASAGTVGKAGTETDAGGISMGWKIAGGVLGLGLLIGLVASSGGGGDSTTPAHQ